LEESRRSFAKHAEVPFNPVRDDEADDDDENASYASQARRRKKTTMTTTSMDDGYDDENAEYHTADHYADEDNLPAYACRYR
jgi:hypothetical protein